MGPPKTLKELLTYRYGRWAGRPNGVAYRPDDCAHDVWEFCTEHQCSRKNGHGPEGLYCKQHAKMVGE